MRTDYRHIRLEDRDCPVCEADIVAICKGNGQNEEFWFSCASPNEECDWGRDTETHQSDCRRITSTEARAQFDQEFK